MILLFVFFAVGLVVFFIGWLVMLFDGEPLQPTWRDVLIRHAEEQHAAIMAGDDHTGIYGRYPPYI